VIVVVLVLVLVCAAACQSGADRAGIEDAPVLQQIDSVVLHETDSVFIARPRNLAAPADGTYLIADDQNETVYHFAPDGRPLRALGRRGGGPGEFPESPNALALDRDSILFVLAGDLLHAIHYRSGAFLWQRVLPGWMGHAIAVRDGLVFFSHVDAARSVSVGAMNTTNGSVRYGGPFPKLLRDPVPGAFHSLHVKPIGSLDSVAVAMAGLDLLFVGRFQGSFDSLRVAVRSRQGSRPDLQQQFLRERSTARLGNSSPSIPYAISRLSTGHYVYITRDFELQPSTSRVRGRFFVSTIDPRTRRTCPDAEIPAPADPLPEVTMRGDTLLVLVQVVGGEANARAVIRKYLIDTSECVWVSGA
jgi:hypothetical protein